MKTRIATAISEGTATDAARHICAELRRQLGAARPVLCVVFASTSQPLDRLLGEVKREFADSAVIGCSTAGEFTQDGDRKGAACAFAVAGDFQVFAGMGRGLKSDADRAVRSACADVPAQLSGYPHRTALMLLDPLAGVSEEAVLLAAGLFGEGTNLAGGAAGDDLKMERTLVGCGADVASDAVAFAVLYSRTPVGIGVAHGHRALSRPLTVTQAEGNVVHKIDGRPAWDVWVEQTASAAARANIDAKRLSDDNVGAFLLRFEAALDCGNELKVRAPLSRQRDGSIAFACGIPEGSAIRITESEAEDQVRSARTAAVRSRQQIPGRKVAGALVFDCICRNLILGDAFGRAVGEVVEVLGGAPIAGFETYGEIALNAGDFSGFHNTTTVVLSFAEE